MNICYETVFKLVKNAFDLDETHFYDMSQSNEAIQGIKNKSISFPVFFIEETEDDIYIINTDQSQIDLKKEVRTGINYLIKVISNNVDEIISIEDTIKCKFSSKHSLSTVSDDKLLASATLCLDENKEILRKSNEIDLFQITLQMECSGIILPEKIENPIKVQLDRKIQLQIMKHLALLDEMILYFEAEIEKLWEINGVEGLSTIEEKILQLSSSVKAEYEILLRQKTDLEEQIASMYVFKDLCQIEISTKDHGFLLCYAIMLKNNCNINQATEIYKNEKEKEKQKILEEEERIKNIRLMFSKKGDEEINVITDAVVKDIQEKIKTDFEITIYGGSTYMEWYKLYEERIMNFPNILVHTKFNYTFANKRYTNINNENIPVTHEYNEKALPVEYGITISVFAKDKKQVDDIEKELQKVYKNEVIINITDPVLLNEFIQIKVDINTDEELQRKEFNDSKYDDVIYRTSIYFKRHPSVYYILKDYGFVDLRNNQRLQVRLLQQAEFLLLCDSQIRNVALKQLESQYKSLVTINQRKTILNSVFNVMGSVFESQEYKQLKMCFKNRMPINRSLFDKALSKITNIYPSLYDKMMQGWTYDQIYQDLSKYASIFNKRWNYICNQLCGSCPRIVPQLGMSGDNNMPNERIRKGLEFYILKMANDPYCTLYNASEDYKEQLLIEQQEKEERDRKFDEAVAEWSESRQNRSRSSSGGIFNTAAGVVIGNKVSGVGQRRDGKKDLFGTSVCKRCNPGKGMPTCIGCPAASRCTQKTR